MNNKKKVNKRLIIVVLLLLITVVSGTFAWFTYQSKESALVLTIGDINNSKVIIKPYQIRKTLTPVNTYTSGVYSQVQVINNSSNDMLITLYYRINQLDDTLKNNGLKYTIESSTTVDGTYTEVKTGDFTSLDGTNDFSICDMKVSSKTTLYYRVYLWLDSSVGNQNDVQNTILNVELNARINQEPIAPVLDEGMIPVTISDDGIVTTILSTDDDWYDYNNQKWANMVLVSNDSRSTYLNTENVEVEDNDILAYYVWIPRYRYRIWTTGLSSTGSEQSIDIMFETEDNTSMALGTRVNEYRTHPAFWWDNDGDNIVDNYEMLPGLWIGKFETTGDVNTPTILHGETPLTNQNISTQFITSLKFAGGNMNATTGIVSFPGSSTYGLTYKTDSHMMKNSEWGAVAYLSRSYYGINDEIRLNNNSNLMTGCGASSNNAAEIVDCEISYGGVSEYPQSTTGNIFGIFDMSGGVNEYLMGNYKGFDGVGLFSTFPPNKYYDIYTSDNLLTSCNGGVCYGHALSETYNWYSDSVDFTTELLPWIIRGGADVDGEAAGIFRFSIHNGEAHNWIGTRSVLIPTAYLNKYLVTYDSGNLLYGLVDTETTTGGRAEYSITDEVVTVTSLIDDGYFFSSGRVYLEANRTYIFNCDTTGTWNEQVELYLALNGSIANTYYRMGSNNNYKFTPTVSGSYWLRFDVNTNGQTHTFSNISIKQSNDLVYGRRNVSETVADGRNGNFTYSISNDAVTATVDIDNGYGFIPYRVDLEAGKTYIFNCNSTGIWGHQPGQTGIYLMLNGEYVTYIHMAHNKNYAFTPTVSGTYWFRTDVYYANEVHTFSNISIVEADNNKLVSYGSEYGDMPSVNRAGYTFAGWYTDEVGGTLVTSSTIMDKANDHTLYAHWDSTLTFTIAAHPYEGTIPSTSGWTTVGSLGTYKKTVTYNSTYGTLPTPTRTGYTFAGWYNVTMPININLSSTTDNWNNYSVLYNIYPEVTYTITMDSAKLNSGTATQFTTYIFDFTSNIILASSINSFSNSSISYNITPPDFDPTHDVRIIVYAGIAGSTNGVSVSYTNVRVGTTETTTATKYESSNTVSYFGNHMLFAHWTANTYTVSYNANGGTGAPANQTKTHGVTLTLSDTKPTRDGYTFLGWSTDSSAASATLQPGGEYTLNESKTLYAVWQSAWMDGKSGSFEITPTSYKTWATAKLRITWSERYNMGENKSIVSITNFELWSGADSTPTYAGGGQGESKGLFINDVLVQEMSYFKGDTKFPSVSGGTWVSLMLSPTSLPWVSGELIHNADGTLTVPIKFDGMVTPSSMSYYANFNNVSTDIVLTDTKP